MPIRMNPHPVRPTTCPSCGYSNGGAFSVCPLCKEPIPHAGDRAVAIAAALAGVFIAAILSGVIA